MSNSQTLSNPGALEYYLQEHLRLGTARFVTQHPYPVLVRVDTLGDQEWKEYQTAFAANPLTVQGLPNRKAKDAAFEVCPIVKREGAPFQDRIGIGRSRNTDVPLGLPRISKYHAFITWSEDKTQYFITDAGSLNGTKLDGEPLPPKQPTSLREGSDLRFGPYRFVFHTADGFCKFLEQRASRTQL